MRRAAAALLGAVIAWGCGGDAPAISTHVDDWRDRVIYQILVDRFANGDPGNDSADGVEVDPSDLSRAQGGDWRGVVERLDYVSRLGMSAIWISPVTANVARTESEDGYHGFWPSDFTTPNPRFGSMEDLRELVREAHGRDLAVIVDIVPNHAGRVFAYDLDDDYVVDHPLEDLPPYRTDPYNVPLIWYEQPRLRGTDGQPFTLGREHFRLRGIGDLGDFQQRRFGDFPTGLRDLDTEHEEVAAGLIETYVRWVLDTDVDGFRIDAVPHVHLPFWQRFCRAVRERLAASGKQRFFLLGEIFEVDPVELARHTSEDALDSGFDFPLQYGLVDQVILGGAAPVLARATLEAARGAYRDEPQPLGIGLDPWQARVAIVDSHDLPRVRGEIDDPFAADQALVAIFTVDAIPAVYYGTEQELTGVGLHERRERLWDTGYREDLPTFALLQRLTALRRGSLALRRGTLTIRYASESGGAELEAPAEDAGVLAWERIHENDRALVVLATHPTITARATIPTGFAPGTRLVDRLGGGDPVVVGADGRVELAIAPRTSRVLFAE